MKIYLNILPSERKTRERNRRMFFRLLVQEVVLGLILVVFLGLLGAVWWGIDYRMQNDIALAKDVEATNTGFIELREIEENFKTTNDVVRRNQTLLDNSVSWTNVFYELETNFPEGVRADQLSIDSNAQCVLRGYAKTREVFEEMVAQLEQSECFTEINIPRSNFVQKEDVSYIIDFVVEKTCYQ